MTLRNNAVTVKYVKQWERCACLHCIICSFLCLLVKLLKWVSQLQTRPSTLSFYLMCLCSCRQTARTSIIQRRFYHRCPDVDVLASRSTHSSSNWIKLMMGVSLYGKLNNLKRKKKKMCNTCSSEWNIWCGVFVGLSSYMTDVTKAYATRN